MILTVGSFLASLVLLLTLSRLTSRWLLELLGDRWYRIALWPGVVAHELSHLLGAVLTFTKVTGLSLFPRPAGAAGQALGSVTHQATRNPVTLILISVFPLLGGSFLLWALTLVLMPGAPTVAPELTTLPSASAYLASWWAFVQGFASAFNPLAWQSWLYLYLAAAVSAHLAPSNRDLGYTAAGFTALSVLLVLAAWGAELVSVPFGEMIVHWLTGTITFFLPLVSYSLALLAIVAIFVGSSFGIKRLNDRKVWW